MPSRPHIAATHTFTGLWIPLVTPFRSDGTTDLSRLHTLVRRLATDGVSGFVACGSTGEAAALTAAEQADVLDTILQAAGPLPVAMGVGGASLAVVLAALDALADRPVAGWLVAAPHYIRPSQDGLLHWFRTIADRASAPVVLYDIPYRTSSTITLGTLRALATHPNIVAIKDCGGDAAKTAALIDDAALCVLAGEDAQLFTTLAAGGHGAITASAHLRTAEFVAVVRQLRSGDLATAREGWRRLRPLVEALFREPNPGPLKAALAQQGALEPVLRAPMSRASEGLAAELAALLSPR